jgi:centromere/kinetochore protein ZW10
MKPVIQHVRDQAKIWKDILPYSAWASATGSLVNAIAGRVISDVLELSDIGADIADRIAEVIQQVESLNDLFIMKSEDGAPRRVLDEAKDHPRTANFADKWIKMQYLGEVLRGNLKDIKFLWFESELSLYFDADEVIELIGLSFEKNHLVRSTIREIRDNPYPKAGVEYQ